MAKPGQYTLLYVWVYSSGEIHSSPVTATMTLFFFYIYVLVLHSLKQDVVPVARLEAFRDLKFSRLESFRVLNFYGQIGGFRTLKSSKMGNFRALKLSIFVSFRFLNCHGQIGEFEGPKILHF